MISLEDANKIMGMINSCADTINKVKNEYDTKRMHDSDAHKIYAGLRFAHIEVVEMQSEIEEYLIK